MKSHENAKTLKTVSIFVVTAERADERERKTDRLGIFREHDTRRNKSSGDRMGLRDGKFSAIHFSLYRSDS